MNDANAGAGLVQPGLQVGSSLGACPPLQSLLRHRHQAQLAMRDCAADSFYFGVLNLAPKLALGKLTLTGCTSGGFVLEAHDGTVRILPTGSREAYWSLLNDLLHKKKTVLQVPSWAARVLSAHAHVETQQIEYLIETKTIIGLPGKRLSRLRGYMNKALHDTITMPMRHQDDYLALNATWYKQNRDLKFRTYDKTSIDWLIANWHDLKDWCPDVRCYGVRDVDTQQLVGFAMGSMLTDASWACYTRRFDRDSRIHSPHMKAFQWLAHDFMKCQYANDGVGGDATLRKDKDRMAFATSKFFKVTP